MYFYMRHKGKKLNETTKSINFTHFNTYVDDSEPTFDAPNKRNSNDMGMQPLKVGIHDHIENNEKIEV